MSDVYKLQYNGMTLAYPGWNGYVGYEQLGYPITYLSDDHVSVTGAAIYTPGSEGITLDSGYDTYYRISGYDITGGSIVDGKLVPTGPCTVRAVEKVNYFTATGNFEKGSNVAAGTAAGKDTVNVPAKYVLHVGHTGDIPASWYSTSNRWKPNNVSSYSITINSKLSVTLTDSTNAINPGATAVSLIGSTQTASQALTSQNFNGSKTLSYNKTFTTTTQNVNYGVSAKLYGSYRANGSYRSTTTYIATATTGTWTATGIAP